MPATCLQARLKKLEEEEKVIQRGRYENWAYLPLSCDGTEPYVRTLLVSKIAWVNRPNIR